MINQQTKGNFRNPSLALSTCLLAKSISSSLWLNIIIIMYSEIQIAEWTDYAKTELYREETWRRGAVDDDDDWFISKLSFQIDVLYLQGQIATQFYFRLYFISFVWFYFFSHCDQRYLEMLLCLPDPTTVIGF